MLQSGVAAIVQPQHMQKCPAAQSALANIWNACWVANLEEAIRSALQSVVAHNPVDLTLQVRIQAAQALEC